MCDILLARPRPIRTLTFVCVCRAPRCTPQESTPSSQRKEKEEDDDDLPELPWKKVTLAAAFADGTDLDDENQVQTADKAVVAEAIKDVQT